MRPCNHAKQLLENPVLTFFWDAASNPGRQVNAVLGFAPLATCWCVFITAGPIIKLCAGGQGDSEGHVL
jgi:hypothetical protein